MVFVSSMKLALQNGSPRPSYKWKVTYHFVATNRGSTLSFYKNHWVYHGFHIRDSFCRPWTLDQEEFGTLEKFSIEDIEMIETLSIL